MTRSGAKRQRQQRLISMLNENPFLTDEELARDLGVSVPTIRLDRAALKIAEYKIRIKEMASGSYDKVTALARNEIMGELVDVVPGKSAISILRTDDSMVFERSRVVRGDYIYSMAETLSIAAIEAGGAIVKVANIKYKKPVYVGVNLVAKAEVKYKRDYGYVVWVFICQNSREIFRGKFILCPCDEDGVLEEEQI